MKNVNSKTILLTVFAFVVGVVLDRLVKNFPFFTFDGDINGLDLANLVITLLIAYLIPSSVSKIIEDQRGIKTCIIDDLNNLLEIVQEVKKIISESYAGGSISVSNKDRIYYVFFEAQLKVTSIQTQINESFSRKATELNKQLEDAIFNFDDAITGGVLAQSTFVTIDDNFRRQSDTDHSKFGTQIKTIIHKVHKA